MEKQVIDLLMEIKDEMNEFNSRLSKLEDKIELSKRLSVVEKEIAELTRNKNIK